MSAHPRSVLLTHGKVTLALHALRAGGAGRPLLLLHGLGERSPEAVPPELAAWPGPVHALDFTGHGGSTVPRGGGYTPEALMADADAALAHLGSATLVGRGLGAWVALLLAGGRPRAVRGAILRDGPGLAGGGDRPGSTFLVSPDPRDVGGAPDAHALIELAKDVRPADYATAFARQARALSGLAEPISLCVRERVGWVRAVAEEPGVVETTLPEALARHARAS